MNDVFGPDYASAYDLLYAGKDYEAECDAIERALAEHGSFTARRLLDLGCGTGGHAIPLALRGYEVVGIDRSEAMLSAARVKATDVGVARRISFRRGDLVDTHVDPSCDAAIMMFAVLGYLARPRRATAALRNTHRNLCTGALLIFDFWYGPAVRREPPGPRQRIVEDGGERIVRLASSELDGEAETCTVSFQLRRMRGGSVIGETLEKHTLRYYDREPLRELLAASGFQMLHLGGFPDDQREPGETGWSAMCVARAVEPESATTFRPPS